MPPPELLPLKSHEPASAQIYAALRRAIINCTLLPGTTISDKELSEFFGVSRQPVREALIKLVGTGLIEMRPQRGTFVTKISPKRVLNCCFIREAVESAVVARAASVITPENLRQLEGNLALQKAAADHDDLGTFLALDDEFHALLARSIDCIDAWKLLEDIKAQMDRVRYLSLGAVTPLREIINQHRTIYEALRMGDGTLAQDAVHAHLSALNISFNSICERSPDWFET